MNTVFAGVFLSPLSSFSNLSGFQIVFLVLSLQDAHSQGELPPFADSLSLWIDDQLGFYKAFAAFPASHVSIKIFLTPLKVVVIEECFTQSYISSEKQTLSLTRFCLPFFVERGTSATYASNLISLIVRLLFPQCVQ